MNNDITYIRNPPKYPVSYISDADIHSVFLDGKLKVKECIAYSEYKRLNNRTYEGGSE